MFANVSYGRHKSNLFDGEHQLIIGGYFFFLLRYLHQSDLGAQVQKAWRENIGSSYKLGLDAKVAQPNRGSVAMGAYQST